MRFKAQLPEPFESGSFTIRFTHMSPELVRTLIEELPDGSCTDAQFNQLKELWALLTE